MLAADQMEAPNIEVTISQELRDLLRAPVTVPTVAKPPSNAPSATAAAPRHPVAQAWRPHPQALRADGQRPLQFIGLPVVSFAGAMGPRDMAWTLEVTVFAGAEGAAYLGFSAHPPAPSGARPIHRAAILDAGGRDDLAQCLAAVASVMTAPDGTTANAHLAALTNDFHHITGHSFRTARSH